MPKLKSSQFKVFDSGTKALVACPNPAFVVQHIEFGHVLGQPGPVLGNLLLFSTKALAENYVKEKDIPQAETVELTSAELTEKYYNRFDGFMLDVNPQEA
jgi:hypothetical protein